MFGFRDETDDNEYLERTLKCISSQICSKEWNNALINIDKDIMELYDRAQNGGTGIIIISSPYNFKQISSVLTEFACIHFNDQSLLNCFEIVLDFLNPNKKYIQDAISSQTESKIDASSQQKFNMTKYESLINSQAIVIINSLNCDYISIPRNPADLYTTTPEMDEKWQTMSDFSAIIKIGYLCDDGEIINADLLRQKSGKIFLHVGKNNIGHFGRKYDWIDIPNKQICAPIGQRWHMSWNQLDYNNCVFSSINDTICEKLSDKYLAAKFEISVKAYPFQDWSKKIDFENGKDIGYLWDDGSIIRGTVLKQQLKKIFVHFSASFGKTYEWLIIPNDRICPPPKAQPETYAMPDFNSYDYSYMSNQLRSNIPRSHDEEDQDLRRAIAESLGQTQTQTHNFEFNNVNENNNNMIEQKFEAKEEVTYIDALDILLNGRCHFGIYDKEYKIWRTAVYMKHWEDKQRIMIRFVTEDDDVDIDKFSTIKRWPVNYISKEYHLFGVTERDLRDKSNVPNENIDAWVKRQNK